MQPEISCEEHLKFVVIAFDYFCLYFLKVLSTEGREPAL